MNSKPESSEAANDYELIREVLEDSTVIIGERRHSKSEALAALDRLMLESVGERERYEAELSRGKWISVEDRLPDDYDKVDTAAVWVGRDGQRHWERYADVYYFSGDTNPWSDDFGEELDLVEGVTHWMPLPQPPKGDSDG